MDQETVKRVWQRVQNPPSPQNQSPCQLSKWEQEEYRRCLWLSRRLPQADGQILRKIAAESREHSRILMGICRMIGTEKPKSLGGTPLTGTSMRQLQQGYGQKMRLASEYDKMTDDPSFGHLYRRMAETTRSHAANLLALLGKY